MEELFDKLRNAEYCVVFTGAGVSTFCGIRDFRGKNGLYNDVDAEKIFSIDYFKRNPAFYYKNAQDFIYNLGAKEPGIVHTECARLEKMGIVKRVITQNIDMLHHKAGSRDVIEVHGSPLVHVCLSCHKEFSFDRVCSMLREREIPYCDDCQGIIKPAITFFGEALPFDAIDAAIRQASRADLLFILGTSLVVQPAASLPMYTLNHGGEIIIVNDQETPLDDCAVLRYQSLEDVFNKIREEI
jgi:NAD-dependent deacetylase